MATLAESFLADLEDLSDDEPVAAEAGEGDDMEEDAGEDTVRTPPRARQPRRAVAIGLRQLRRLP